MTKIAIITDTHFGVRSDSLLFLNHQKKFLDDIFFPILEQYNVETVVHLGDLVDRRKYINYITSYRLRKDFLNKLKKYDCHFIAGNHDVFHKNTNKFNCYLQLVEGLYPYHVYIEPREIEIEGVRIAVLPWINNENQDLAYQLLSDTQADLCFGHLEINGFEMNRGVKCEHGMGDSVFSKFQYVFSGHFHQKSDKGNIFYLGAPYQMTWADYNCDRGFHLFDLETRELQFVKNPYQMFYRLYYNDVGVKNVSEIIEKQSDLLQHIENSYCKIVIEEKSNTLLFDQFTNEVERRRPYDVKIVEQNQIMMEDLSDNLQCEDTITIINKSIDNSDIVVNKTKLKSLMNSLYNQSLNLEIG